jgi:hypothetical protein
MDEKYVDYYSVRDAEARIDRARYEGRSTVNVGLGLRVDYAIAPKQHVFVDFSTTSLGAASRTVHWSIGQAEAQFGRATSIASDATQARYRCGSGPRSTNVDSTT